MPPPDRRFEGSLSGTGTFRPEGAASKDLRFLPREQHADVFLDLTTGEEGSVFDSIWSYWNGLSSSASVPSAGHRRGPNDLTPRKTDFGGSGQPTARSQQRRRPSVTLLVHHVPAR